MSALKGGFMSRPYLILILLVGYSHGRCMLHEPSSASSYSVDYTAPSSLFITNSEQVFKGGDPFVWMVKGRVVHATRVHNDQANIICSFPFSGASDTIRPISATLGPCSKSVTKHGSCIYVLASDAFASEDAQLILYKMREPYVHARCEPAFLWPTKNVTLSIDTQIARSNQFSDLSPRVFVDSQGGAFDGQGGVYVSFDNDIFGSSGMVGRVDEPFDQEHDYRLSTCQASVRDDTVPIDPVAQVPPHLTFEGFLNDGSLIMSRKVDGSFWTLPRDNSSLSFADLLASEQSPTLINGGSKLTAAASRGQKKLILPGPERSNVIETTWNCNGEESNGHRCKHFFVPHMVSSAPCERQKPEPTRRLVGETIILSDNLDNPPSKGSEKWVRYGKKGTKGARLYSGSTYAHSGQHSLRLQDDSAQKSTATLTNAFDASQFDAIEVKFWHISKGFDTPSDDFLLEITSNNGDDWETIGNWAFQTDFVNRVFYDQAVQVPGRIPLTSQMKIRFRCDAGSRDKIFIDDIEVIGSLSGLPSASPSRAPSATPSTDIPTQNPSKSPSSFPSGSPSEAPSNRPSPRPPVAPAEGPSSNAPSKSPSSSPFDVPSVSPSRAPSKSPSSSPFDVPSVSPSRAPSKSPSSSPFDVPSVSPSRAPSKSPSSSPSGQPSPLPSSGPSETPTESVATYFPGLLKPVDNDGLRWSEGLTSYIIASTGDEVAGSGLDFHSKPDAAACFPLGNGKWVYASNSESSSNGGVGGIYFDQNGQVEDYEWLLDETYRNCGGGKTPWNTWISCEENGTNGYVYEVDVEGSSGPAAFDNEHRYGRLTCLGQGGGNFESVAYDGRRLKADLCASGNLDDCQIDFFVTNDRSSGELRKYTPKRTAVSQGYATGDFLSILSQDSNGSCVNKQDGAMEYLEITNQNSNTGQFQWTTNKNRGQSTANSYFANAEGIEVRDGLMYIVSKARKLIYIFDLDDMTWERQSTISEYLTHQPDQIRFIGNNVNANDLLYFTEDGGQRCGIHARNAAGQYVTIVESNGSKYDSETTGIAFSPDKMFMYFAFQGRGDVFAVTRDDGLPFDGAVLGLNYE